MGERVNSISGKVCSRERVQQGKGGRQAKGVVAMCAKAGEGRQVGVRVGVAGGGEVVGVGRGKSPGKHN